MPLPLGPLGYDEIDQVPTDYPWNTIGTVMAHDDETNIAVGNITLIHDGYAVMSGHVLFESHNDSAPRSKVRITIGHKIFDMEYPSANFIHHIKKDDGGFYNGQVEKSLDVALVKLWEPGQGPASFKNTIGWSGIQYERPGHPGTLVKHAGYNPKGVLSRKVSNLQTKCNVNP
jgi:hypothetical protein